MNQLEFFTQASANLDQIMEKLDGLYWKIQSSKIESKRIQQEMAVKRFQDLPIEICINIFKQAVSEATLESSTVSLGSQSTRRSLRFLLKLTQVNSFFRRLVFLTPCLWKNLAANGPIPLTFFKNLAVQSKCAIQTIKIARNVSIENAHVLMLLKECPKLTILELYKCSGIDLDALLDDLTNFKLSNLSLTLFNIARNQEIDDEHAEVIAPIYSLLAGMVKGKLVMYPLMCNCTDLLIESNATATLVS